MDNVSVNQMQTLRTTATSTVYQDLMKELYPLTADISTWIASAGGANARVDDKDPTKYVLTTTFGDLSKLVHELTHIRCHQAYHAHFICYHVDPIVVASVSKFDADTKLTKLMNATMDGPAPKRNKTARAKIVSLARSSGLSQAEQNQVIQKISQYGDAFPHVDHDTVINQVFVWLNEWGYPKKDPPWYSRKKPTKKLFRAVEAEVAYLMQQRAAG